MTKLEITRERNYRIDERLGMLCGTGMPTQAQLDLANKEADDWEKRLAGNVHPNMSDRHRPHSRLGSPG